MGGLLLWYSCQTGLKTPGASKVNKLYITQESSVNYSKDCMSWVKLEAVCSHFRHSAIPEKSEACPRLIKVIFFVVIIPLIHIQNILTLTFSFIFLLQETSNVLRLFTYKRYRSKALFVYHQNILERYYRICEYFWVQIGNSNKIRAPFFVPEKANLRVFFACKV